MPVEHGSASQFAIEMRQHEATHTQYGAPGRPFVFREFPKMLFRFTRVQGKGIVLDQTHTVNDDLEQRNMESRGFHERQEQAIAAIEREQTEHGTLAAEREHDIRHGKLSERAVTEVRAAEAEHGARHLPSVPETPIRKRLGRKTNAERAAAASA